MYTLEVDQILFSLYILLWLRFYRVLNSKSAIKIAVDFWDEPISWWKAHLSYFNTNITKKWNEFRKNRSNDAQFDRS